jgi:hypothetical protein
MDKLLRKTKKSKDVMILDNHNMILQIHDMILHNHNMIVQNCSIRCFESGFLKRKGECRANPFGTHHLYGLFVGFNDVFYDC